MFCYSIFIPIALALKICNADAYNLFINGKSSEWLGRVLLSDTIYKWVFNYLTDKNDNDYITAEVKETIVSRLYEAMLVKQYDNGYSNPTKIGNLHFNKNIKKNIVEAISLASKYTDLS